MFIVVFAFMKNRKWFGSKNFEATTLVAMDRGLIDGSNSQLYQVDLSGFCPLETGPDQFFRDMQTPPFGLYVHAPDPGAVPCFRRARTRDAGHSNQIAFIYNQENRRFVGLHGKHILPVVERMIQVLLVICRKCDWTIQQGAQAQFAKWSSI